MLQLGLTPKRLEVRGGRARVRERTDADTGRHVTINHLLHLFREWPDVMPKSAWKHGDGGGA